MILKDAQLDEGIHIDFVPMVDVLFNLLIFFLLATTIAQVEREMQIALPFATSAGPISTALREIIVNVDAEGRILVAGRPIEAAALRTLIADAVKANPEQKVTVRGDRTVAYGTIVGVLDLCKGAGVQEPYLDTVLEH
jgi:biopolymer transport protein ExbD